MFGSSMTTPEALAKYRAYVASPEAQQHPAYMSYLTSWMQHGGTYVASYAEWKASRDAAAAAALARKTWIDARTQEILAACPVVGWPDSRGVGVIPCSLDEAARRAEMQYMMQSAGVAVAVPAKTAPPLPPDEVTPVNAPLHTELAPAMMMAAPGGGIPPPVWVAVAAGALYLFSRRGRRA
jgi:hypothetical protein